MEKELWNYPVEDIKNAYTKEIDSYTCLLCGKQFPIGRIYKEGEELFDAYGAVKHHVTQVHISTVDHLLEQEETLTGISKVQQKILSLMSKGKKDVEIAKELGISQSTVRNHRFKLREKQKQAKLFLAMMTSLEEKVNCGIQNTDLGELSEVHATAKMVDDRYMVTEKERVKILKTVFDDNGALREFPAREKKKLVVLSEIMKNFKKDTEYTEREVNKVLKRINVDYPTLRRALIEYGFMERSDDCKVYRVKE